MHVGGERTLGSAVFAAVWTPNPDHPYTWSRFFGLLAVVFGCAFALIWGYAAVSTWRGLEPSRRHGQVLPVALTGGFFVVVGLVVAAYGVWIF